MIDAFIVPASSFAQDVDFLFELVTYLVGIWFLIAQGALFYFIFKFRYREGQKAQYVTGEKKEEKKWISTPHYIIILFDIVLIAASMKVWYDIKQDMPVPDEKIKVISQQWAWTFIHAGPDGQLDTADDITLTDELHLQEGKVYHYFLESKDVLHSFSIPVFRLKQDAVPGRVIKGWFKPIRTGTFDIQCAEMCGIGHGIMRAELTIHTPDDYKKWMASVSDRQGKLAQGR